MINEKHITRIGVVVMAFACLFVLAAFVLVPDDLHLTYSYVDEVFDKNSVTQIDISISQENWDYLLENATLEEYVNCDVTVNGTKFGYVGIRAKGNSSLSMVAGSDSDRYSFKLDFDQYVKGQTCFGLEKIALNNIMSDSTYMKEYMSYEMFSKMGVPTPAYAYANITVNGEPWGLYIAIEVMEESFLQRTYGSSNGNLYKPDTMEMGGGVGRPDMGGNGVAAPFGMQPPNMEDIDPEMLEMFQNGFNGFMPDMSGAGVQDPNASESAPQEIGIGQQSPDGVQRDFSPDVNDSGGVDQFTRGRQGENGGERGFGGGGFGMGGGTNLVYVDDEISSYYGIFNNTVLKKTTEKDYQKVITMIKNLNAGTDLEKYLDVDEILRYFAVNTFLVNLDSYAGSMKHNYYLYENNGVFQILPWDFNMSFAGFQSGSAQSAINFPIDKPVTDSMENSPLISKLLEVEEYKDRYHDYLDQIVREYVEMGAYEATILRIDELINEYVENDPTAFCSYEDYESSIPILVQFGYDRAKSIAAQLTSEHPSDSYGDIETSVDLNKLSATSMGNMFGGGRGGRMGEQFERRSFDGTADPLEQDSSTDRFSPELGEGDFKGMIPENLRSTITFSPSSNTSSALRPDLHQGLKDMDGISSEIEPQSLKEMISCDNQLEGGNTLQDKPPTFSNDNITLSHDSFSYNSIVLSEKDTLPLQDDFIDKVATSEGFGTVSEGFTSPLVTNPTDETGSPSLIPQLETDRSENAFPFNSRNWADNAATGKGAINTGDIKTGIGFMIFTASILIIGIVFSCKFKRRRFTSS